MKKWFYAHRKQIFALVVGLTLILNVFTCTCFATEDDYPTVERPTVTAPFPDKPTYSNPVYVDNTGLGDYLPLYNSQLNMNFMPSGYEPIPYTLTVDSSALSSTIANFTPLGTDYTYRVTRRVYQHNQTYEELTIPYIRNSIRVADSVGNRCDGVAFTVRDFWYIPYLDYVAGGANIRDYANNRDIMKIRLSNSLLTKAQWGVTGTFQYMGNVYEHEFSYFQQPNVAMAGFNINYLDIIRNSAIGRDGWQVPIYIKELTVIVPLELVDDVFLSSSWIDVYTPCLTEDEYNALYDNNFDVFENTSYNYQQWEFDFTWAMNAINSVLNAPLFGMITLGGISFTIIGTLAGIALLKLLGGVK